MNDKLRKKIALIISVVCVMVLGGLGFYEANKDKSTEEIVQSAVNEIKDYITTYEMSQQEIEELPSTEIIEQTEEQENKQEQEVEDEAFELQGEIAYEGDRATTWDVELGDYKALVYYNQTDARWRFKDV